MTSNRKTPKIIWYTKLLDLQIFHSVLSYLLTFWSCFNWHISPISDENTPSSIAKYTMQCMMSIIFHHWWQKHFGLVWPVKTSRPCYVASGSQSLGMQSQSPVELIQCQHVAPILDALDRHNVAMTRRKHFTINVARQRRSAGVLESVVP